MSHCLRAQINIEVKAMSHGVAYFSLPMIRCLEDAYVMETINKH